MCQYYRYTDISTNTKTDGTPLVPKNFLLLKVSVLNIYVYSIELILICNNFKCSKAIELKCFTSIALFG